MQETNNIKLVITDFDGTLTNTFDANLKSYRKAFDIAGLPFSEDLYKKCFGIRFDGLMDAFGIKDEKTKTLIKHNKAKFYKENLNSIILNESLLAILKFFKSQAIKIALASTASRQNLLNVLEYFRLDTFFDIIVCGEDVKKGKPAPDIYLKVLENANVKSENAITFEDSVVVYEAAKAANIKCIGIQTF